MNKKAKTKSVDTYRAVLTTDCNIHKNNVLESWIYKYINFHI
jgi:hypothetical protein